MAGTYKSLHNIHCIRDICVQDNKVQLYVQFYWIAQQFLFKFINFFKMYAHVTVKLKNFFTNLRWRHWENQLPCACAVVEAFGPPSGGLWLGGPSREIGTETVRGGSPGGLQSHQAPSHLLRGKLYTILQRLSLIQLWDIYLPS